MSVAVTVITDDNCFYVWWERRSISKYYKTG